MRKALYILGSLDDADIEWMARHGKRLPLKAGEVLIQEGGSIDYLFIVLEGQLTVRIGQGAGKEIAVLFPGEIVGEISFVDNRKPTASVIALQDSRAFGIERHALLAKLDRDSGFAARFYRAIATFLADRLYVTTSRFGYGKQDQDIDVDIIEDSAMDEISMASIRFDKLLRYLADEYNAGSFASGKE